MSSEKRVQQERLYCSICGEARGDEDFTCRSGGKSVPVEQVDRRTVLRPPPCLGGPDPTPDQPCPHGCVNGVLTADEGTSSYCPIHSPTPDQPEQEHDDFIRNEMRLGDDLKKYEGRWVAVADQQVVRVADSLDDLIDTMPEGATILGRVSSLPFFGATSPSLHQRIEGLIAEFENYAAEARNEARDSVNRGDFFTRASADGRAVTADRVASRLRAVLKGEA